MDYQALYRKYRPQTFDEILGQAHVSRTLANAITEDRVAHAYLFTGPRGTARAMRGMVGKGPLRPSHRCPECRPDPLLTIRNLEHMFDT